MKAHFLHKRADSKELVLFFAGFASHPSHFVHLDSTCSVLMLYDYEDFEFELDLSAFTHIRLIAFSMGVCIAANWLQNKTLDAKITQKIAINGTNFGIHKQYGIHPRIFKQTIQNFELEKFKKALFDFKLKESKAFIFKEELALKKELENLWTLEKGEQSNEKFLWDKVYMSLRDKIFPQSALKSNFDHLILLNEPHFAFFAFKTWQEI